jgi:DNA-binding NtrC family response regulator
VRELEQAVEVAAALCSGESITEHDIREAIGDLTSDRTLRQPSSASQPLANIMTLNEAMFDHIRRVFEMCGGNAAAAARTLGISRTTLFKRLKELGLVRVTQCRRAEVR